MYLCIFCMDELRAEVSFPSFKEISAKQGAAFYQGQINDQLVFTYLSYCNYILYVIGVVIAWISSIRLKKKKMLKHNHRKINTSVQASEQGLTISTEYCTWKILGSKVTI